MLVKILSIFNFEWVRYVLHLRNLTLARVAVACLALAMLFYYGLDALGLIPLALCFAVLIAAAYRLTRPHHSYVSVFLLSLFLFFIAGECYIRIDTFGLDGLSPQRYRPADYGNPFAGFLYATNTYTGLAPGSSVWFKGAPFSINAMGFRGNDFPPARASHGDIRIALIGASASMGAGVADEDLFSVRIQDALQQQPGRSNTHVMNFGISGANWGNMLHVLDQEVLRHRPDLILFHVHHNLASSLEEVPRRATAYDGPPLRLYLSARYRFFRNHSFFSRLLWMSRKGNLLHQQIVQRQPHAEPQEWLESRRMAFTAVIDRLQTIAPDIPIGLFILRPMSAAPISELASQYRTFIREYANEHGFFLIDGYDYELTPAEVAAMILYPGDHHPNHRGHAFHAQTLTPGISAILQTIAPTKDDS